MVTLRAARVAWQEKDGKSGAAKERPRNSIREKCGEKEGEKDGKKGCEKASHRYPCVEVRQIHDDGVGRRYERRGASHTIPAHTHTHTHTHTALTALTALTAPLSLSLCYSYTSY